MDNPADNVGFRNLFCQKLYHAVIDEDPVAGADVMGQPLEGNTALPCIAENLPGGQGVGIPILDLHRRILFKSAQPNLRPLGIQHGGDGKIQFLAQAAYHIEAALLGFIVSVGKVEACHIHAAFHQIPEHIDGVRCRAHCTNDFRFPHSIVPFRHK